MSSINFNDALSSPSPSLGSLEKTILINELIKTPLNERNTTWLNDFLSNIDECNLQLGNPEVAIANDGFPYMNVHTVDTNENFKAFVIKNELLRVLSNGFGLVVNSGNGTPDWVFTYGDLLNYHLNNEFYTEDSPFSEHGKDFEIPKEEQIVVGQPSETILPAATRGYISQFLRESGIPNGKVLLLARNVEDEELASQDLVFNIHPGLFRNMQEYEQTMNGISWMLPRHYSIVGIDENTIESGFELL